MDDTTGFEAADPLAWEGSPQVKWELAAERWHALQPPAVPSAADLRHFRELLGVVRPRRALVLGATPGLRTLAHALVGTGGEVVVVDFSRTVYERVSARFELREPESFVEAEWSRLPLEIGPFDAALGDKVVDNIEPARVQTFLERLATVLRLGGSFIHHTATSEKRSRFTRPRAIIAASCARLHSGSSKLETELAAVWEELLSNSVVVAPVPHVVSLSFWGGEILEAFDRVGQSYSVEARRLSRAFMEVFGEMLASTWADYTLEELVELGDRWFELQDVRYADDYEAASFQPILRQVRVR